MTAESFFNLRRAPFEKDVPVNALYMTPNMQELISRLEHVAARRKFAVVTGPVGVGKTTAIRKFIGLLDTDRFRYVYIADSALKPRVFYWEVLTQMSADEKPSFYRTEGKRRMLSHMQRMIDSAQTTIVLIDEAHLLSHEMLEETRFLLNNEIDSNNPMALVIIGQLS